MSQLNDISLIAQVVMFHNNRAFDQLVRKYQSPVRRFFLNLTCGDSELSDDLAQDTFIRAYTSLASFKNLSSFSTRPGAGHLYPCLHQPGFLQEPVQLLHLALPHCVQPIL